MTRSSWLSVLYIAITFGGAGPSLVDAATVCSSGLYGVLVTALSTQPAAQSFCTSRFPIPHATSTITAPVYMTTETTTTVTSTAPATTVVVGTTTVTTTVTTSTTSTVAGSTYTVFCPTSTAAPLRPKRRAAKRAATATTTKPISTTATTTKPISTTTTTTKPISTTTKPTTTTTTSKTSSTTTTTTQPNLSSALSVLSSMVSASASTLCSCIETTITDRTTTTPTSTYTPTTTTTPTSTTTATTTSTTTSTVTQPVAQAMTTATNGQVIQGTGACGCIYTVNCDQAATGTDIILTQVIPSEDECVTICDNYDNCFTADYQISTGICTIFRRNSGTAASPDDNNVMFARSCPNSSNSPNCIIG